MNEQYEPDNPDPLVPASRIVCALLGSAVLVIAMLVSLWVCAGGAK